MSAGRRVIFILALVFTAIALIGTVLVEVTLVSSVLPEMLEENVPQDEEAIYGIALIFVFIAEIFVKTVIIAGLLIFTFMFAVPGAVLSLITCSKERGAMKVLTIISSVFDLSVIISETLIFLVLIISLL